MSDASAADTVSETSTGSSTVNRPGWLIPALVVIGIASGVAGVFIVGSVQQLYYPEWHGQMGDPDWYLEDVLESMMTNDAIGFGSLGAILFGLLGALLGFAKSAVRGVVGLVTGAVSGGLVGAAVGAGGYYIQDLTAKNTSIDGIVKAFMVWGPAFIGFGLVGALLAVCVGPGKSWVNALVMGIFSAIATIAVYAFASTAIFPIGHPNALYPEHTGVRYLAMISVAISGALAAVLALRQPSKEAANESGSFDSAV